MTWKKAQPKDRFDFRESTTCSECLCMCIRCFERKKNTTKARNLSNKNKRNYRFPALLLFVCVARKVLIWRFQSIARVLVNYSSDLKLDTQQRKRKKKNNIPNRKQIEKRPIRYISINTVKCKWLISFRVNLFLIERTIKTGFNGERSFWEATTNARKFWMLREVAAYWYRGIPLNLIKVLSFPATSIGLDKSLMLKLMRFLTPFSRFGTHAMESKPKKYL